MIKKAFLDTISSRVSGVASHMLFMAKTICSVCDCNSPATRRSWCQNHYYSWKIHGDPLFIARNKGFRYHNGYKQLRINGEYIYEHILIMEKHIGRKLFKHPTVPGLSEEVHHHNEIKDDNRLDNLLLTTKSEHMIIHHAKRRLSKGEGTI